MSFKSQYKGRDEIFAQLLPAFEECFGNTALDRITERFGETYTLAHQAAKHLDLEVKRLGHGKEKQDAAEALLTYMRSDRCQNLLSGLTLFSRCHDDVVEEVCRSNIPSTLCKCVFLFSDLKPYLGSDAKKELQERQAVAGKLFGLLTNLVDRKAGLQELLQGNNNFTLLSRVTLSRSTNMNVIWRDGAMDVVVHMFKSSPGTKRKTRHVTLVRALQERQFMSNLIESVRRERTDVSFQMRSLRFAVELLTAVGAFSALLETDFVNAKGYEMIAKVVLSLDGELMLLRGGV
ncbi:hypothetical protein SARC_00864 [Sphaeroforma arctica JP610]|uniref:Uncharacterized protein n=1 Tax=Sphaeroforma arctica JP610 TaxID=667725 RepID=A0A0L0GDP9_9EUKA|nr:hypothetical protein SARC_00864 [Sphaeroforma arctica JP610]KNC87011.1 hypothetical protein SARC_00864 [Sphaeroforma arctica JP610]|eukprot:XP_014160913.1 hypothetical protein SARC_00864 [Sphaeroforma arctica JP610]